MSKEAKVSKVGRRDFLKSTTAVAAAAALPLADRAEAAPPLVGIDQPIPPQRVQLLYGLHAYTDKLSVEPGEDIQFQTNSTVPYDLSVCRLGVEVDDPAGDEILMEYPESTPRIQPIRPGSYVHVDEGIAADQTLDAMSVECWIRPHLCDNPAGIVTQFDLPEAASFALFLNPDWRLSFYLGDGKGYESRQLHHSPSNVLKKGEWSHVVGRWDGTEKSIWVNGEKIAAWPFSGEVRGNEVPIRLGARGDWGEAYRMLDADIAMPTIYGRALSEEEIQQRHQQQALAQPQGGDEIIACWPLSEERGEAVADISGHGHHGRIINFGTWMIGGPSFDRQAYRVGKIMFPSKIPPAVTVCDSRRMTSLTVVGNRHIRFKYQPMLVVDFTSVATVIN